MNIPVKVVYLVGVVAAKASVGSHVSMCPSFHAVPNNAGPQAYLAQAAARNTVVESPQAFPTL